MSATVIDFPFPMREGKRRSRSESEQPRLVAEKRQAILRLREHLEKPSQSGKKIRRKLPTGESAIELARRIGEDLGAFKRSRSRSIQSILDVAGILKSNRSRFALFTNEMATPASRGLRLQGYVRLSDSLADALERDRDLYLHGLLQGLGVLEVSGLPEDEDAVELCVCFDAMARYVANRTDLLNIFDRAALTPGVLNSDGRIQESSMMLLRDRAFEGAIDHYSELQPLPNVPLFRLLEQELPACVRLGPTFRGSEGLQPFLSGRRKDVHGSSVSATVEVWREIGLTIAERNGRGSIGALFSGRPHIRVRIDETSHETLLPMGMDALLAKDARGRLPALLVDNTAEQLRVLTAMVELEVEEWNDLWTEPAMPEGEPSYAVEHYYSSYHPVTPWTVRRLLDWAESKFKETQLIFGGHSALSAYRLGGEIGRSVEAALISQELEEALIKEIEQLKSKILRSGWRHRNTVGAQDNAAFARWSTSQETE